MKHPLIVMLTALSLVIFTVPKVEANPANPVIWTVDTWGNGQTCAVANLDAIKEAGEMIGCVNGTCKETPVVVDECFFDPNSRQFLARWKIRYQCNGALPPPPPLA